MGQGEPIKRPNAIRTKLDTSITTTAAVISLFDDFLLNTEDIMSVSITPDNVDTILIAGAETDDYVNIGDGIVLNLDLKDKHTSLPWVKSISGTETISFVVAVKRR